MGGVENKSISDDHKVLWSPYKAVHSYVTLKLEMCVCAANYAGRRNV